jgi:hypothetical protein
MRHDAWSSKCQINNYSVNTNFTDNNTKGRVFQCNTDKRFSTLCNSDPIFKFLKPATPCTRKYQFFKILRLRSVGQKKTYLHFLISNFSRVLHVVCFLSHTRPRPLCGSLPLHYLLCNRTHPYSVTLLTIRAGQTFSCWLLKTILKFSHSSPTSLWRWNRQSVPKRRHIKFRHRRITQKKTYNIPTFTQTQPHQYTYIHIYIYIYIYRVFHDFRS